MEAESDPQEPLTAKTPRERNPGRFVYSRAAQAAPDSTVSTRRTGWQ